MRNAEDATVVGIVFLDSREASAAAERALCRRKTLKREGEKEIVNLPPRDLTFSRREHLQDAPLLVCKRPLAVVP